MTPREWESVSLRHYEAEERAFLRSASIQATMANIHSNSRREPFTAADFMPEGMAKREPAKMPTREEWIAGMRTVNAAFGGEDLTEKNNG
jgi:hypothetical protein